MPTLHDVICYWWDRDLDIMKMTVGLIMGGILILILMVLGLYVVIWSMPTFPRCGEM